MILKKIIVFKIHYNLISQFIIIHISKRDYIIRLKFLLSVLVGLIQLARRIFLLCFCQFQSYLMIKSFLIKRHKINQFDTCSKEWFVLKHLNINHFLDKLRLRRLIKIRLRGSIFYKTKILNGLCLKTL